MRKLLIEKKSDRPEWSPSTLEETDPSDVIKSFFDTASPYVASAPRLELNRSSSPDDKLTRFALPSEATIQGAIKGSLPGSGSFALTPQELITSFEGRYGHKLGLKQKIEEVISEYIVSRPLVAAYSPDPIT